MTDDALLIAAVRHRYEANPRYSVDDIRISRERPFLGGKISTARFKRADGTTKAVYVFKDSGREVTIIENVDDLISHSSVIYGSIKKPLLREIDPIEATAAVIAIALTLTIISILGYDTVSGRATDLPAVLVNSLTTVIGFYFGRAGAKQAAAN